VGVTLYELLCNGEHPYKGGKPMASGAVQDPRQIRPDLNDALADFLKKACAPYREDRFATAVEMRWALENVRTAM
jgi:serine/threonine protein kinase